MSDTADPRPIEEGWERHHRFLQLDRAGIERRLRSAFAGARVLETEPLAGGLRNTNYRVRLAGRPNPVVVRLYTADPTACRREAALAALVKRRVPVPAVLHLDADADPPFAVSEWIDGVRFDDLVREGDPAAIEAAARAAGACLARIHAVAFPTAGFLGPDLEIATPLNLGADWASHVEGFVRGRAGAWLDDGLVRRLERLAAEESVRLKAVEGDRSLVHADYKPWNLLLSGEEGANSGWDVAAVLDWEFAFSGPPLVDVAIFLRHAAALPPAYKRGFVTGYVSAGGNLQEDWRALTKLLDVLNLLSILDQPGGGHARSRDVGDLLLATVEDWEAGRFAPPTALYVGPP